MTLIELTLGLYKANVLSTPSPNDIFLTVKDELRSLFLEAEIRISSPENLKSVTFKDQKVMLKSSDKVETINLERFTKLDDKVNFLIENNL